MRGRIGKYGETISAGLDAGVPKLVVRAWLWKGLYKVIGRNSVSLEWANSHRNNRLAETIDLTGFSGYTMRVAV